MPEIKPRLPRLPHPPRATHRAADRAWIDPLLVALMTAIGVGAALLVVGLAVALGLVS